MAYENEDRRQGQGGDAETRGIQEPEQPAMQEGLPGKKRRLPRNLQKMGRMGNGTQTVAGGTADARS